MISSPRPLLASLMLLLALVLPAGATARPMPVREYGYGVVKYRGHSAGFWYWKLTEARRALVAKTSTATAIRLAAVTYHVPYATLRRKAYCESKLGLYPNLFQFIGSTWRTTPFARFSILDPVANALAAGWMHAHGRGGEWACR
jgi:hypothetical protein